MAFVSTATGKYSTSTIRFSAEFSENLNIDRDYKERVTGVYDDRTMGTATHLGTASASMPYVACETTMPSTEIDYVERDRDHQSLKLDEERLVANKQRQKREVSIGKHAETQPNKKWEY